LRSHNKTRVAATIPACVSTGDDRDVRSLRNSGPFDGLLLKDGEREEIEGDRVDASSPDHGRDLSHLGGLGGESLTMPLPAASTEGLGGLGGAERVETSEFRRDLCGSPDQGGFVDPCVHLSSAYGAALWILTSTYGELALSSKAASFAGHCVSSDPGADCKGAKTSEMSLDIWRSSSFGIV